jgi:uncharacterized membrane protein YgcG
MHFAANILFCLIAIQGAHAAAFAEFVTCKDPSATMKTIRQTRMNAVTVQCCSKKGKCVDEVFDCPADYKIKFKPEGNQGVKECFEEMNDKPTKRAKITKKATATMNKAATTTNKAKTSKKVKKSKTSQRDSAKETNQGGSGSSSSSGYKSGGSGSSGSSGTSGSSGSSGSSRATGSGASLAGNRTTTNNGTSESSKNSAQFPVAPIAEISALAVLVAALGL